MFCPFTPGCSVHDVSTDCTDPPFFKKITDFFRHIFTPLQLLEMTNPSLDACNMWNLFSDHLLRWNLQLCLKKCSLAFCCCCCCCCWKWTVSIKVCYYYTTHLSICISESVGVTTLRSSGDITLLHRHHRPCGPSPIDSDDYYELKSFATPFLSYSANEDQFPSTANTAVSN